MKKCIRCYKYKPLDKYYKHKQMLDGHLNVCIECKKKYEKENKNYIKYDKTEKGVIRVIYKTQIRNSISRNMPPPSYTKHEFKIWLYENNFEKLFNNWKNNNFDKNLKPSVNRLNDYKGYSFDNIQLVTWMENKQKQYDDILLGRSTSGERCKPVQQFSLDGKFIKEYVSYSSATRETKITNIDAVCHGRRKSAGGYIWKYKF